jgi:8-oxo-dGTP diphosphatase
MYSYDFSRPALTADVALVAGTGATRTVLLIRRGRDPFAGRWALPGGFVDEGERIEDAARRELAEETGIVWEGPLFQAGTFGDPGRDPRGWTVTVCWAAHVGDEPLPASGGDDADEAAWFPLGDLPELAFDHADVIETAVCELDRRRCVDGSDVGT